MVLGSGIKGNLGNIRAGKLARLELCWMQGAHASQVSNWSAVATEILGPASWALNLCSHVGTCRRSPHLA